MMNCSQILESFTDYDDEVLEASARADFEMHLEGCTSCRRYVEVVRKGRSLLAVLPPVEVGEDFTPRLQHRLFHVEDGHVLARERSAGSGTTAVTLLAMTVLLALAAWSPTVRRPMVIDLPAIVVNEPPPRPVRLMYHTLPVRQAPSDPYVRSLWTGAGDLLHKTSHIQERYRNVARAGLE